VSEPRQFHDPEEFVRRVAEAIQAEAWVLDGNYGPVRDMVSTRATHLLVLGRRGTI
jgi:hypothetical protein